MLFLVGALPVAAQQEPDNEWTGERFAQWCADNQAVCTADVVDRWCRASAANKKFCQIKEQPDLPALDRPKDIQSTFNGTVLVITWTASVDHPEPEKYIAGYSVNIDGGKAYFTTGTRIEMDVPEVCDDSYLVRVQAITVDGITMAASAGRKTFICPALPTPPGAVPGLVFFPQRLEVVEGGSETFEVRLATRPSANVSVSLTQPTNTDIRADTDSTAAGNQTALTFTDSNWNRLQRVSVFAARDDDTDDDSASVSFSASGGSYDDIGGSLRVSVRDSTPKMVVIDRSLQIDEGRSKSFIVRLETRPTAGVRVTLTQPSNTDVRVDTDTRTSGNQNTLSFTTSNWNTSQHVVVSTAYDEDTTNDAATISLRASGGNYEGLLDSVSVSVIDHDLTVGVVIPKVPHGPTSPGGEVITVPNPEPTPNPTNPPNPNGPSNPGGPTNPPNPNGPSSPGGPTDPSDPNAPTSPGGSTNPSNPNGPTDPSAPGNPSNPSAPTNPKGPDSPTDATGPTGPEGPSDPSNPDPGTPEGPTVTDPKNPSDPTTPGTGAARVGLIFDGVPLILDEGEVGNFRVRLAMRPTEAVTLAVGISLGVDLEVDADVAAKGVQNTVVIDPVDWDNPRDVKVTALRDEDDSRGRIIFQASGGNYEGIEGSVSVKVNDRKRKAAWLTRFARMVGLQAIEGIESRMDSATGRNLGLSARIAGRDIEIGDASTVMRPDDKGLDDDFEREDILTLSQVLSAGASFNFTQRTDAQGNAPMPKEECRCGAAAGHRDTKERRPMSKSMGK
ncbi:hypothetical protein [Thioalkalivibrio sp. HK1]|uniref:hypothetical protein n=1 Tax=Thioalkalivibrio sp. HK1 TaxID=1469245 RepID=UPI0004B0BAD5|nr:hypothetical protein [Thioalkalivibrio sp. HK1]